MDQHSDNLNFGPRFLPDAGPSPTRMRSPLTARILQNSLIYYDGNYEGDTTMLSDTMDTFSLIETDSETELQNDIERYIESAESKTLIEEKKLWHLVIQYVLHFLPPELILKIIKYTEKFLQGPMYGYLKLYGNYLKVSCLYLNKGVSFLCCKTGLVSKDVRSCLILLRNLVRRLLWWLTLAKCGDIKLFFMVLICAPLLFLFAVIGFVLTLYSFVKNFVQCACDEILNFFE